MLRRGKEFHMVIDSMGGGKSVRRSWAGVHGTGKLCCHQEGELLWTVNSENYADRMIDSTMMVKRMLLQQRSRIATQMVDVPLRSWSVEMVLGVLTYCWDGILCVGLPMLPCSNYLPSSGSNVGCGECWVNMGKLLVVMELGSKPTSIWHGVEIVLPFPWRVG